MQFTRRQFIGGAAGLSGVAALGGRVFAAQTLPKDPIQVNIVDVAGNLALTQGAFDSYAAQKPNVVSMIAPFIAEVASRPGATNSA